ncbi:MAG: hypothetical protein LUQ69_02455 [Methanoregulaceae archaeon]|jgi:hypothetical protein|nr:hypothetical protein [Methanoregulaceae archaeon]
MGRSLISVRMGVKAIADRWLREAGYAEEEDASSLRMLASMAKRHSSEAFYAFDDPLEAALYSVLIELLKEQERD